MHHKEQTGLLNGNKMRRKLCELNDKVSNQEMWLQFDSG